METGHFATARTGLAEPDDQAGLPGPRLGWYGVIDERVDLDLIAAKAPISTEEPKVDDSGRLTLKGYFDTTPSRVNYNLTYIMSDGEWKLVGINVDLKKPDK